MTELPLVIVDVQRGGPSTGLPTKPEQADPESGAVGPQRRVPAGGHGCEHAFELLSLCFLGRQDRHGAHDAVLLLSDGFIANGSEPWRIPSMREYPKITPPIVTRAPEGGFQPYARDEKRLARMWALPGTKGVEHRVAAWKRIR